MGRINYAPVEELISGAKTILREHGYDEGVALAYNCQDDGLQLAVIPIDNGSNRSFRERLIEEIERSGSCDGTVFSDITISDPATYQETVEIMSDALTARFDEYGEDFNWHVGDKTFIRRYVLEPVT